MKYVIIILVLLSSLFSWGQQLDLVFRGTLINIDEGKKEGTVKVDIVQAGAIIASSSTASNGKFKISANIDQTKPFELKFSKPGFVGKMMRFDFAKVNEEDIPPGGEFFDPFEIDVFKERDNADFSFLKTQPVATFDWNTQKLSPRLNSTEANNIKNKILTLLAEADKNKAEAEMKYNAAIKEADAFYASKSYEQALAKYEEALGYKPTEKYPADKIIELDALIQAQKSAELADKQANEAYYNLIEAGDNLRDQDDLANAISKYKEAVKLKDEQYPKDQIASLTKTLEDRKKELENQAAYDAAIKAGDAFLKQNSVRAARDKFTEASKLKPSEQYPKDKLAEIEGKMNALAEKEAIKKKYDDAVIAADALFTAENFEEAKTKYEEALTYESSSTYVKGRIGLCDEKIKAAKEAADTQAKIAELLQGGTDAMTAKDWTVAKSKFEEVISIESGNPIAIEKLAIVNKAIADAENLALQEEKYAKLITEGEAANASNKLEDAVAKFEEAQTIKVEPAISTKIQEIKAKIVENEAAEASKLKYDQLMSDGEAALSNGDLVTAKSKFTEASNIDPSQDLPKTKLTEIEALLKNAAEDAERKAQYDAAIASADNLFNLANWEEAKTKYREAMTFDDSQTYASDRIAQIDDLIKEKELADAEAAKAAEVKAAYDGLMSEANALLIATDYQAAKAKFKEAQTIDPSQTLPAEKISEIDGILSNLEAQQKAQEEAEAIKKAYDDAISTANGLFDSGKFNEAKTAYNEAIAIDNSQTFPQERIAAIDKLLSDQAAADAKAAQIEDLLDQGAKLISDEKFEDAKAVYTEILGIDPGNIEAQAQLTKVNSELAALKNESEKEEAFNALKSEGFALADANQFDQAKQKLEEALTLKYDAEVEDRIKTIEKAIADLAAQQGKDAQYSTIVSAAESAQASGDYQGAIEKYKEAQEIKPEETLPAIKIAEIEAIIQNADAAEQLDKEYNALLEKANGEVAASDYEGAINSFTQASSLKPNETLPKTKIAELQALLNDASQAEQIEAQYNNLISEAGTLESNENYSAAIAKYKEAQSIKPTETLPATKIAALQAIIDKANANQAQIDAAYTALMSEGDQMVANKDYLDAIKKYNEALSLKPNEQEPVDKAAEAERLEKEEGQETDAQYEKILTVAEKKIESGEYDKAIELINRAIKFKPEDSRPQGLLDRIETIKRIDAEYNNFMTSADQLASSKKYEEAKEAYKKAQNVKPSEPQPAVKIAEMEALINELSNADQKDALYNDYMAKGGLSFGTGEYQSALGYYQNALSVKPGDSAAQSKISEIQQILDDIANADAMNLANKNKFDALIRDADGYFANEGYLNAKKTYEEALKIDPSSSYAKTQVKECERLEREKGRAEAEKEYRKIVDAADKNFNKASYDKAVNYYNRALSIKKEDPYPKQKLQEIYAILNPTTVETAELEDLGDPFDENNLIDGGFVLQRAESDRKFLKKTKINRKQQRIKDAETELALAKTESHYQNSNEIYMIQQKITRDAGESDLNRQATVDALRKGQLELQNEDRSNINFEHGENLSSQGTLDVIKEESTLDYGERHSVYEENTDIMTAYNTAQANATTERILSDYDLNLNSNQELATIKGGIEDGMKENFDKRAETGQQVVKVQQYAGQVHTEISGDRYDELLIHEGEIQSVARSVAEKAVIDSEKPKENDLEIKGVRYDIVEGDKVRADVETASVYKVNDEIADVKRKVLDDQGELTENRVENNELLKNSERELAEAHYNEYNTELAKYISNKGIINEEVKVNGEVDILAKEAHAKKVSYVDIMDKKARIDTQDALEGDEENRLNAQQNIENVYIGIGHETTSRLKEKEATGEAIKDVDKAVKAQDAAKAIGEQDKHYDASAKISKVDDTPRKQSKVANSLGEEYPEGVSQESFTKSDNDGLVTTIITRRVVVIDGHADVYIRTQTLSGITYSKNGKPSLAHVWNKETQGAHLERHF